MTLTVITKTYNEFITHVPIIFVMWINIFVHTYNYKYIPSYICAITTLTSSILGLFYYPIIKYGMMSIMCYYITDIISMGIKHYNNKDTLGIVFKNVFMYHHLFSIISIADMLNNETKDIFKWNCYYGICIELSTIILNWRKMNENWHIYSSWPRLYPKLSQDTCNVLFVVVFLITRVCIFIPMVFYTMSFFPIYTNIFLSLAAILNIYWSVLIIEKSCSRLTKRLYKRFIKGLFGCYLNRID